MTNIFDALFKKKKAPAAVIGGNIQTTPLSEDLSAPVSPRNLAIYPQQLLSACGQSNGLQRDHNEDSIYSLNTVVADGKAEFPFGLFIVADGMGGHLHGEIASQVAVRAVAKYVIANVYYKMISINAEPMDKSLQEIIEAAIQEAQKAVLYYAPGGGTTLTCALILGDKVTIGHVGDSRAYFLFPDGRTTRISQDHSLVQRMVDLNEITEEEALAHPNRNVLLRALGQSDPVRPDIQTHQIPRMGSLLLCSDGLWGVVSDNEINQIAIQSEDLSVACHQMVQAANKAGGPDNISVILVKFAGE